MPALCPFFATQFFDNSGLPLAAGKLYTYISGTTTNKTTYQDQAGATPHANPIVLDAAGRPPGGTMWLGDGEYTLTLKTTADVLVKTWDDVGRPDSNAVTFTQAGSGAVERTVQDKLREVVSVADYGAVGSGAIDDQPAIALAVTYLESVGGGILYYPRGTAGVYLLGATIGSTTVPILHVGAGLTTVELRASHSAGPVVRIGHMYSAVRSMTIGATTARKNGAAGQNYGILDMAPDTAGFEVNGCAYDQVYVKDQPSHGLVFVSHYKGSTVSHCRFGDIGGHGIYGEDGTSFARVNKAQVGGVEIRHTRFFRCTGHAVAVGSSGTNYGYRWVLDNIDAFHCALTAGVRNSLHTIWLFGENMEVKNSGIGGWSGDSPRVLAVGGVRADGRNARITNNRYIDVLGNAVTLGPLSDGAVVEALQVTGEVIAALNPAVVIESGCTAAKVSNGFNANITTLATPAAVNTGNTAESGGLVPTGFRSRNQEFTLDDDTVQSFTFTGVTRGILALNGNSSTSKSPIVAFRVGDGSAYCRQVTSETNISVGTGDLTNGTTDGVDGDLNIYADTDSFTLYVKNRRAFTGAWMPTFLSIANGEVVL